MSTMSTASSKLRNLKEFLSSTRSLSTAQSQIQVNQLNPSSNNARLEQGDSSFKKGAGKNRKSPKNSMSLFNIMSATSKEGSKQGSHRGRPVSVAFDDLDSSYSYSSRSPPTKSISMFGLAPSDESAVHSPASAFNYNNQCGASRGNLSSRNFATRLFHNIRSKFRKRRRDRSKIVDSKSSDFGEL